MSSVYEQAERVIPAINEYRHVDDDDSNGSNYDIPSMTAGIVTNRFYA